MATWRHWGATVHTYVQNGVMILNVSGLATPGALRAFCEAEHTRQGPVYSILALFDMATVALDADSLTAPLKLEQTRARFSMPAAIVCRQFDLATFKQHARQCAELGIVREAFTATSPALAWCRAKAQSVRLAKLARMGVPSPFAAPLR